MDQEDPEGGNDEAIDGNGNKVTVGFTNKKRRSEYLSEHGIRPG